GASIRSVCAGVNRCRDRGDGLSAARHTGDGGGEHRDERSALTLVLAKRGDPEIRTFLVVELGIPPLEARRVEPGGQEYFFDAVPLPRPRDLFGIVGEIEGRLALLEYKNRVELQLRGFL